MIADSRSLVAWFNIGADRPIRQSTLRAWATRGRLEVRGRSVDGLNLYRYGDVDTLIRERDAWLSSRVRDNSPIGV